MARNVIIYTFLALISISCFSTDAIAGSIYVIERTDGSITFTSRVPRGVKYRTLPTKQTGSSFTYRSKGTRLLTPAAQSKFHSIIEHEARRAGIDTSLVKAVVHVESGFNPRARSRKGAMGLMQLMPETARILGVKDPYRPEENIKGGVKFLARLLGKYNGNLGLSLAAYNAGEFAVKKYGGIPPYDETIDYVKKVIQLRNAYKVLRG